MNFSTVCGLCTGIVLKNESSDGNITKLEQEKQESWQAYSIWA